MEETRYCMLWRNKYLTSAAQSVDEMVACLREAAAQLEIMRDAGVVVVDDGGMADDYAILMTTDPEVASRFDMINTVDDFEPEEDEDDDDDGMWPDFEPEDDDDDDEDDEEYERVYA